MAVILVTGGAGYIGAHTCKALAAAGHRPVVYDNLRTGWRDAVKYGPLIEGDLLDRANLAAAFDEVRPAAVIHFAALSIVGESVTEPELYWRNNVVGTLNLLTAMHHAKVRRIVFSSTAAVYGENQGAAMSEDAPTRPNNTYGATKLAIEAMLADFAVAHAMRYVVFRYFNVAGADPEAELGEAHVPETHLIPRLLQAAARGEAVRIFGDDYITADGTCIRDYVHVHDIATAHSIACELLSTAGESLTLNLGTGHGQSVRQVLDCVREVTGAELPAQVEARREGDAPVLVCDASRAAEAVGWRPTRSDLRTIVGDAWTWHRGPGFEA
ncbi:MAG: UDP-glucose 4-epimerase GalE [Alphaproteobacteria bacterium]